MRSFALGWLVLAAAAAGMSGCRPGAPGGASAPAASTLRHATLEAWTHEEITQHPEEYLVFAAQQVLGQVGRVQTDIETLRLRRRELEEKSAELMTKVDEAQVVMKRLGTAIRRAEDEERWPLVFAGKTFTREGAKALQGSVAEFLKLREPRATAYRDALQRLASHERALEQDIAALQATREQISIDLEYIQINRGLDRNNELRRTADKIASISKRLTTLDGMTLDDLGTDPAEHQSIGDLMSGDKGE